MKKIIYLIFIISCFVSCEEVVELDLATGEPHLIIDAVIERNFSNDETYEDLVNVQLRLSTGFYDMDYQYVNDATILLEEESSGNIYNLELKDSMGNYSLGESDLFEINITSQYSLSINYNGENYFASEIYNEAVPIDGLVQVYNNNAFAPDDRKVTITFTDNEGLGDYYIFPISDYNFQVVDDEFLIDGGSFSFQEFIEEDKPEEFTVKSWGSDVEFNTYIEAIAVLAGNQNGPFGSTPFNASGNIINTTNPDNIPYGYFHINGVYSSTITLVDNATLE